MALLAVSAFTLCALLAPIHAQMAAQREGEGVTERERAGGVSGRERRLGDTEMNSKPNPPVVSRSNPPPL